MLKKCTVLFLFFIFLLPVNNFAEEDSTKTKTSVLKGLKLSLNFYENFLKLWANHLENELLVGADTALGLEGARLPWGFDVDIQLGGEKASKLRFPFGYSYMRCKNPGKDEETYVRTCRHIIFGGLLIYMNDFEKGNIVPYISGNAGCYIYSIKHKWNTENEVLGILSAEDNTDGYFSYYLTGGLIYCPEDLMGISLGVNFNGEMNDISFSLGVVSSTL